MPGITIGRVEHDLDSTKIGRGRASAGTVRQVQQIASDGKTIAIISHTASTMTATSVNVYYTTNFGVSWTVVPGTPPTPSAWASNADTSIGGIYYEDGKWIVVIGDSRLAYTTNITSNWSTWTITGTVQTNLNYSNLSYSPTLNPRWVVRNISNNGVRLNSTTFGTWNAPTNAVGANCEDFASGKLNGVDVWIALLPVSGGIHQLSGSTFQTRTAKTYPGTVNGRSIVYYPEAGLWIAACDNQVIYTSPDTGTDFTWTARSTAGAGTANDTVSLVYIKGIGVICGTAPTVNSPATNELGRILFSKDGITWTLISAFDDSTSSYGYGFGGISFESAALMLRAENSGGGTPTTTADGSWYTTVLVADR